MERMHPDDIEAIAEAITRRLNLSARPTNTRMDDFKAVFATGGVEGLKSYVKNMPPNGGSAKGRR